MISEQRLLEQARQFDQRALADIYDTYSPRLFRYATRLLSNTDVAEDCVAEVFSRFLNALQTGYGPKEHLQAYLYRIAHNWITDFWRAKPPPVVELEDQVVVDPQGDPSMLFITQIEHAQVRMALTALTPEQRQVILLKFVDGLDNEEIATTLGKPISAIKSMQHRAIGALRRQLLKEEQAYEPA